MQVNPAVESPTAASTARRTQIVAATIEVISEEGLNQTSFARIAARAGLSSTRLISYHFANKDELIGAVVQDVLVSIATYVGRRIDAAEEAEGTGNATALLRAYIEGNISFIATHRPHMQALLQIVLSGGATGRMPEQEPQPTEVPLAGLLRHGQTAGEFRDFHVASVAGAIQRAIEGLPFMLAAQPDLDCDRYSSELVELYLRGVRRDAS